VNSEHHLAATADGYQSVEDSLLQRLETWDTAGLNLNRIIFDPGIGFGKSSAQSMQIMERAGELRRHGLRVLVGHSRKSFLNQTIGDDIGDKDRATVDLSLKLSEQGVDILRVHNVPMHTAAYREAAQIHTTEFLNPR
jgi:dihydropteroate synthase